GCAHVDLEGPRFVVLPVEEGVALDDTFDINHPVPARVGVRAHSANFFAVDGAVNDDVADMNALGPIFFRNRLGEGTQARLSRIEGAVTGSTASRWAPPGEA